MLVPVPMPMAEGPPTDLLLKMKPTLLATAVFQAIAAICRIVVGDIWGGMSDILVAMLGYLAAEELNIMYVLYFGLACATNFLLDATVLLIRLARVRSGFFNPEQTAVFNLASFAILAATLTALLGAALSYIIWRDFRLSRSEAAPFLRPPGTAGGYSAAPWAMAPPPAPAPGGASFEAFSGTGFRLNPSGGTSLGAPGGQPPFCGRGHSIGAGYAATSPALDPPFGGAAASFSAASLPPAASHRLA
mmetsp:Transcript_71585/g.232741  ORF Transcript_71585/g.232741 Transcript_71585/m.232741 type:complete len:247 (-) Transcript_71585:29-769(-)